MNTCTKYYYHYQFYKHLQLINFDDYNKLGLFIRSMIKKYYIDNLWKKICCECKWQF